MTQPGQWHHFEFYGKLNSSGQPDGHFKLWIDGILVADNSSWTWIASGCDPQSARYKWNTIFFPSNYSDVAPNGSTPSYYIDDVEVWNGMPVQ